MKAMNVIVKLLTVQIDAFLRIHGVFKNNFRPKINNKLAINTLSNPLRACLNAISVIAEIESSKKTEYKIKTRGTPIVNQNKKSETIRLLVLLNREATKAMNTVSVTKIINSNGCCHNTMV